MRMGVDPGGVLVLDLDLDLALDQAVQVEVQVRWVGERSILAGASRAALGR